MNYIDYLLLTTIPLGIIYGMVKGLRAALWLLVVLLGIVLANYFFVGNVERIFISLSGLKTSDYPDAPGVAVFLLNEKPIWAGIAALTPVMIAFIIYIISRLLGWLINSYILAPPSLNNQTRLGGAITGLFSAMVLSFLLVIQLDRLPWAWTGELIRESLFIDRMREWFPSIIRQFSAGKS